MDATTTPAVVVQAAPAGFVGHRYATSFSVAFPRERVWAWLNDPATFVDGQVWPWRVEFLGGGFEPGVLTAHYGPLMLLAGVVGEIRAGEYRDLRYCYGSHVLGMRLARPSRLQFWVGDAGFGGTRVSLQVDSFLRPWLAQPATAIQRVFWRRFGRWMERALRA